MAVAYRSGLVVTDETGEILRRFGDLTASDHGPGWLQRQARRAGAVKTFDFDTMTQVASPPVTEPGQGRLFS